MLSLHTVEFLIKTVTLLFAYCMSISIAGAFQAWIAKKMGDDTAEQLGFLTLNPLAHVNTLGLVFLFYAGWGWGTQIPINPLAFVGPWRRVRFFIATYADVFIYIALSIIVMTLLLILDPSMMFMASTAIHEHTSATLTTLARYYPTIPSAIIVLILILTNFMQLNIIFATLSLTAHLIDMGVFLITRQPRRSLLDFDTDHLYQSIAAIFIFIIAFSFLYRFVGGLILTIILLNSAALLKLLSTLFNII